MRTCFTLLLAFLCSANSSVHAQGGNQTVFQRVFTDKTDTGASAPVRNVAQTEHLLYWEVSDVPPGTCVSTPHIALEASFDGSNFFIIAFEQGVSGIYFSGTLAAKGSYPYIRASIPGTSPNCKVNAWYSGTLAPSLTRWGLTERGAFFSSVTTSTQGENILQANPGGVTINIESLVVRSYGTQTNVEIYCEKADSSFERYVFRPGPMTAGDTIVFPPGDLPYAKCAKGSLLTANLSDPVTVTFYLLVSFGN